MHYFFPVFLYDIGKHILLSGMLSISLKIYFFCMFCIFQVSSEPDF